MTVSMILLDQVTLFYSLRFFSYYICVVVFKGMGLFVCNQDGSKESIRHEKIQSNMELVLLCISISAVILALILLTALR